MLDLLHTFGVLAVVDRSAEKCERGEAKTIAQKDLYCRNVIHAKYRDNRLKWSFYFDGIATSDY
jgi:hypothetical protein